MRLRYYKCGWCFSEYTSLNSDGDLCDRCCTPLDNMWEETEEED